MKLRCTNGMATHWVTIFREGKEYDVIEFQKKTQKTPKHEIEKALKIKKDYEFENSIRENK